MLQAALTRSQRPVLDAAPTYGGLIAATRDALDRAIFASTNERLDAEAAYTEILGYERFLLTAGNHLHTLLTLADVPVDGLRRLTARLNTIQRSDVRTGAWFEAATKLGGAHDLLATHLTSMVPWTPDGEELLLGPASAAACADVTSLILEALPASRALMHRGMLAQKHRPDHPIPWSAFRRIRVSNDAASLYARSTLWDLRQSHAAAIVPLDDLQPAIPTGVEHVLRDSFQTTLGALRVLRQISHTQVHSAVAASPASVRDVAVLGARITDPSTVEFGGADGGLAKVRRADALDRLSAAHEAWSSAGNELTRTIRGLTKAPAAYGGAVRVLLEADLTPSLRLTLARALPRLGSDAGRIVERMANDGSLVTLQPVFGQPRRMWQPIAFEHGRSTSDAFADAATASNEAATALRDLTVACPQHEETKRDRRTQVEQTRTLSRGGV
ncbi:MAG: hypothetical protein ACJ72L_13725 [Marmoricola sp.]